MPIAGAGAGLHGWHLSEFRALGGMFGVPGPSLLID